MTNPIEIRALGPPLLQDYLDFFEGIEFRDHPDWSVCFCHSFHFTGSAEQWTKENNRKAVIRMINAETMKGYLAYDRGIPVGWCNVNNRDNFQRMVQYEGLLEPGNDRIASMVCFLVHPDYRRQGIAARLIERIEHDYRSMKYDWLEAYPGKGSRSQEEHYTGPPSMFLSRGYRIIRESEDYYLVRKLLH